MFTRLAGSTSRRALSVVTQVQPSTHTVATRPVSTDNHISEFDRGRSSLNRCTCQPISASVAESVVAPTIRQGAIGRTFTDGYGVGAPAADAGDGATFVQVGPACDGAKFAAAGTVAILVVVGPAGATGHHRAAASSCHPVEDPTVPCRRHRPAG